MQAERRSGHKALGVGPGRPCDIDDIALAYRRLVVAGKLDRRHERALVDYGMAQRPPDRRVDPMGVVAWDEALDRLSTVLVAKGIVEKVIDIPVNVVS